MTSFLQKRRNTASMQVGGSGVPSGRPLPPALQLDVSPHHSRFSAVDVFMSHLEDPAGPIRAPFCPSSEHPPAPNRSTLLPPFMRPPGPHHSTRLPSFMHPPGPHQSTRLPAIRACPCAPSAHPSAPPSEQPPSKSNFLRRTPHQHPPDPHRSTQLPPSNRFGSCSLHTVSHAPTPSIIVSHLWPAFLPCPQAIFNESLAALRTLRAEYDALCAEHGRLATTAGGGGGSYYKPGSASEQACEASTVMDDLLCRMQVRAGTLLLCAKA